MGSGHSRSGPPREADEVSIPGRPKRREHPMGKGSGRKGFVMVLTFLPVGKLPGPQHDFVLFYTQ